MEVPGRIALAGFGDFEVARCCHPRLTTIAVDCANIGRRAAEVALGGAQARNRNEPRKPETTGIEFRVVARKPLEASPLERDLHLHRAGAVVGEIEGVAGAVERHGRGDQRVTSIRPLLMNSRAARTPRESGRCPELQFLGA